MGFISAFRVLIENSASFGSCYTDNRTRLSRPISTFPCQNHLTNIHTHSPVTYIYIVLATDGVV